MNISCSVEELKIQKSFVSHTLECKVDRIYAVSNGEICRAYCPGSAEVHADLCQRLGVNCGLDLKLALAVTSCSDPNALYTLEVEVFESDSCVVVDISYIGRILYAVFMVLRYVSCLKFADVHLVFVVEEIACDMSGIFSDISERSAVKAAGCDLDLRDGSVFIELDLLCAALT